MQLFEINDKIGPKVFMLKKMSIDLFFFLFLLMVIGSASSFLLCHFVHKSKAAAMLIRFRMPFYYSFIKYDVKIIIVHH